jgi:hypothetical protein
MKSWISPFSLFLLVLASPASFAADSIDTSSSSPPRLSLSLGYYHYSFQGRRAANDDLYAFGDATYSLQLFVAQYALAPKWTLAASTSYASNHVETLIGNTWYDDTTSGFTDTRLIAVHPLVASGGHLLITEAGLSIPTGSIGEWNKSNPSAHYPYNLQLGSGTVDPVIAGTYLYSHSKLTHGARLQLTDRFMDNRNGYHLGNELLGSLWSDLQLTGYFAPGVKFNYRNRQAISGSDVTLGRQPLTEFYYHPQTNWDFSLVAKSAIPLTSSLDTTLDIEAGAPIFHGSANYDGVDLAAQYYVAAGIQASL